MTVEQLSKNPYVGPKPFEANESNLFFGRDWETEELTAMVVAHPAVLFYAQSGAGKSSLLNARVLIWLEVEEGCEVLPVARVRGDIQIGEVENIYAFNTLMSWSEKNEVSPAELAQVSLVDFLSRLPRQADDEGYPVLRVLVFDQFEELFTFYPDRWPEREQFFQQVSAALEADPFLRVLFVIREDYLAQLDTYASLLPEQLRPRFRLERLREEAALLAVEGPLKASHRSFAPGVAQTLVKELLMIRVEGQAGQMLEKPGEFVEPVQLQVVCQTLWAELPPEVTEITLDQLRRFGNIDQALTRFYERAIEATVRDVGRISMLYREYQVRKSFDEEFITPAGTRGLVYQERTKTGIIPNNAIKILENHHIIRGERRAGARWYELTHDRLIGPIQLANRRWRIKTIQRWAIFAAGFALCVILISFGVAAVERFYANERANAAQAAIDVAQAEAASAQAEAAYAQATTTAIAQTVRKDWVRPLRSGLSIGGINGTTGTLGYFVIDEQGQVYILSSVEVLGTTLDEAVLQPSPFDGGQRPEDIIGQLSDLLPQEGNILTAQTLVALARLAPGIQIEATVPDIGPILGTQVPAVGMAVSKLGRSTGLTRGTIASINQVVTVQVGERSLRLQGSALATLDSSEGDEGALVVNQEGYAVGIVIAVVESSRQTVIAPLQPALTSFGIRLLPTKIEIQDISSALPRNPNAVPYPTRDPAAIKRIVLHHTAVPTTTSVEQLAAAFINEGRPGFIYHYCVLDQGLVYQTQPEGVVPYPNDTFNQDSINVCLMGDFSETPPSQPQLNATAILVASLLDRFRLTVDQVYGHSELVATQSPGTTWPSWRAPLLTEIGNLMDTGIIVNVATPVPTPTLPPMPTLDSEIE